MDYSNITIENYSSPDEIFEIMEKYGVVIIENYIKTPDDHVQDIFDWFLEMFPDLSHEPNSWIGENLPSGPRYGMYQSLVGNCPTFIKLREDLYKLFCDIYDEPELMTSIDGMSFYPPYTSNEKDWPHIDQLKTENTCYQSQIVLTDTTASFVCTPGSHKLLDFIKSHLASDKDLKGDWFKFKDDNLTTIQEKISELKKEDNLLYNWQIPIVAPKGSVILWYSNTIHSSRRQVELYSSKEHHLTNFINWRCVVYICMRPKKDFRKQDVKRIRECTSTGRMTNHWGKTMFPKKRRFEKKSDIMFEILDIPEEFVPPSEEYSSLYKKLTGIENY